MTLNYYRPLLSINSQKHMKKKFILDLSMVTEETLRAIEETLLIEHEVLRDFREADRADLLKVELLKLEDYLSD